jgi:hypothetical protein
MSLILSGSDGLSDIDGSASTPAIRGTDANTGIFFPAADTIAFSEGGAEVMRIDSDGDVGIGTTSPDFQLQLEKTAASTFVSIVSGTSNTAGVLLGDTDSATIGRIEYDNASNFMTLYTNSSERARIDSSGNLLVGTTTAVQKLTVSGQLSLKNSQNLAVINAGDAASVLNNGTLTLTGLNQSGLLVINNNADQIALYLCSATGSPFTTEISDPSGVYSTASGTASNTNVYFSGGVLTLENKTGSTRIYRIHYLTN